MVNIYETLQLAQRSGVYDRRGGINRAERAKLKLFCRVLEWLEEVQNGAMIQRAIQSLEESMSSSLDNSLKAEHMNRTVPIIHHIREQGI